MPLITTTVDVTAGQTSTGDTVVTPGRFQVFSGGAISETAVVDDGSVLIYSGGTATATTLQGGGFQEVYGAGVVTTAVDTLIASAGIEFVESGRRDFRSDSIQGRTGRSCSYPAVPWG